MATIFSQTRKSTTKVLPSGIEVELLSLTGKQQKDLTINDESKRKNAIDNMLLDCTGRIGSKTTVTPKDIEKLFSEDRKYMLFELQQFSNDYDPEFRFAYEFPTKDGKKLKDTYIVMFTKEDFPKRPYKWVMDEMIRLHKEKNEIAADVELDEDQLKMILIKEEYPVMFTDTYDEIIEKYKQQKTKLKECGVEVVWNVLDGIAEKENAKFTNEKKMSSHTYFQNRDCKYLDPESLEKGKEIPINVPYDDVSTNDLEQLRETMLDFEASIETNVVVSYKGDTSMQANLNLVTVPAFFFRSLAK